MKRNEGFTLVELLVSFAVGAVVTLAATSVMLLGLRLNAISSGGAQRQNTTRILMSVLERIAADGTMTKLESTLQMWKVYGEEGHVILSYNDTDDAIYSGSSKLLEGVIASHISLNDKLLTVSVETEDGTYSSSIYCRMAEDEDYEPETLPPEINQEIENPANDTEKFVNALMSQYPSNGFPNVGVVLDEHGDATGKYYATWYAEKKFPHNTTGWDSTTPWCTCFVSWAMWKTDEGISNDKLFANVDEFMEYMKPLKTSFEPGDVIFFDWNGDRNPEHVGVVVHQQGNYVYTIEGNSADRVALRMYEQDDPCIIGAGTIEWE